MLNNFKLHFSLFLCVNAYFWLLDNSEVKLLKISLIELSVILSKLAVYLTDKLWT